MENYLLNTPQNAGSMTYDSERVALHVTGDAATGFGYGMAVGSIVTLALLLYFNK